MNSIIEAYQITTSTLALLPARAIDYDTIVMKENETKHVRQTSMNLIESACFDYDWTTYDGRRKSVIRHTGYKNRTPIPISIHKSIYFFPTHSPKHTDNIWIAFQHILMIGKVPKQKASKQTQSIVYFKSGQELILNISFHTLEKQYERTLEIVSKIAGLEGLNKIYTE